MITSNNHNFDIWKAARQESIIVLLIGIVPIWIFRLACGQQQALAIINSLSLTTPIMKLFGVHACISCVYFIIRSGFLYKSERIRTLITSSNPYFAEGMSIYHGAVRLGSGAALGYSSLTIIDPPFFQESYSSVFLTGISLLGYSWMLSWLQEIVKIYRSGSRSLEHS